jgi:hypothetical protein
VIVRFKEWWNGTGRTTVREAVPPAERKH